MARASGSYPAGRWFKSDIRYHKRPVGQAVKTRPFHGCNMGSIPVRVTITQKAGHESCFFFFCVMVSRTSLNTAPSAWRDSAWVRNIALPLPCRKPCKAEQIPVRDLSQSPHPENLRFSGYGFACQTKPSESLFSRGECGYIHL